MDLKVDTQITMLFVASLLLISTLPPSISEPPPPPPSDYYSECRKPYECGGLQISYPFWGYNRPSYCGGVPFELICEDHTYMKMGSQNFSVVDINPQHYIMKLVPLEDPVGEADVCLPDFNFSLSTPLMYNESVHNITLLYNCTTMGVSVSKMGCPDDGYGNSVVYYNNTEHELLKQHSELKSCHHFQVPAEAVRVPHNDSDFPVYFGKGFVVNYTFSQECVNCMVAGGVCGSIYTNPNQFACYYPHNIARNQQRRILVGIVAVSVVGVLALAMVAFLFYRRKKKTSYGMSSDPSSLNDTDKRSQHNGAQLHHSPPTASHYASSGAGLLATCFMCKSLRIKGNQDIETFLENHGVLTLKRYKFSDVKKMTNSFKVKLGQGGFGAVYKGKLRNGSNVAVKMLIQSKGNGEEFINEVASISRTSHVNVVTLLGFCLEGHKKVLIYEFMCNGSLDNFIFKKEPKYTPLLSWEKLYQISIGIARGLEYLHRGCNIRILHFDIKPHNILLDESFCPKISDFGLAKLCPRKESHISMSETRGTIGYIAPEVFNRNFGRVSHKSDVYSYGMMLIDMVGMKENNKIAETGQTSEKYFPDWIYKKLEQDTQEGPDDGELSVEENDVVKKMTVVGLWCIQPIPDDRPTMSKVVEMLEGSMNSLEMPPRPVLSSPIRLVIESSSIVSVVESSISIT